MSTRYHISANGKPAVCKAATEQTCPLGGQHFRTRDEADFFVQLQGGQEAAGAVRLDNVTPYRMELTPAAERLIGALQDAGFEPYIVGGSVRDAVMGGITPKDIDIEVYGGETAQVAKALRKLGAVDEVGKSFGVLKIRLNGEDFDVSLPRRDSKTGDSHRDFSVEVDPNLSLEAASSRRDYTINALMYSHRLGTIIDNHGGLQDLKSGYLRHVSDAFDEDPLRVLRGVQMASRFDMRLHPDTIEKAQTLREKYSSLAVERVQIEFQKLYEKGRNPVRAMDTLRETGWNRLFPGLAEADQQLLDQRLTRAQALIDSGEIPKVKRAFILATAVASTLDEQDRLTFLKYTTVGDELKNAVNNLTRLQTPTASPAELRKWAHAMPRNVTVRDWTLYQQVLGDPVWKSVEAAAITAGVMDQREADLISGDDLLQMNPGRKPGPWVRAALDKLRDAQYEETFRDREAGLAWLRSHNGSFS